MQAVLVATVVTVSACLVFGVHKIDEGHLGLYYRGGALLDKVNPPGFHLKIPLIDSCEQVQITLQTDKVTNVPCGTSGGVLINFEKIEVVNKLDAALAFDTIRNYSIFYDNTWIYDKVHHEINQLCSRHTLQEVYITLFHTIDDLLKEALQHDCNAWAPGIKIIAVRITKPRIPQHILDNYERIEAEKTKLMIATEAAKVTEKQADTERRRATMEAEGHAAVSKITMEQKLREKEASRTAAAIEDEIFLAHQKALSDADAYTRAKQAEANTAMLTPAYLALRTIESLAPTTKVYFGERIPSTFVDVGALLGALNATSRAIGA